MFRTETVYEYIGELLYPEEYAEPLEAALLSASGEQEVRVFVDYANSLISHLFWVQAAGTELGVPLEQLRVHDLSKFDPKEFGPYAHWFYGTKDKDKFENAWLRHVHRNTHHPIYWALSVDYAAVMPQNIALEMIADWLGASRAYNESWDIAQWILKTEGKILLHPDTARFVSDTLVARDIVDAIVAEKIVTSNPYDENAA